MELVYQNIEESVYSIEIDNIEFYFSSSFNLRRFKEKSIEYAMQEERKLIKVIFINKTPPRGNFLGGIV